VRYLRSNVEVITTSIPGICIEVFDLMIGTAGQWSRLDERNSTGTMVPVRSDDSRAVPVVSFDETVAPRLQSRVVAFKTDIDGYDSEAIESALMTIKSNHPIVFVECYFSSVDQKNGILRMVRQLMSIGYDQFGIFDNFGNFVAWIDKIDILESLLDYIGRQNSGQATRTIFYYDLVAVPKTQRHLVDRALEQHLAG